ncbi:hypothetical protein CONLIGDRAFT_145590 [Coniochaeta ligniaria NRRL 30616]|uniref:Zn(2)-C6 fungal-type domain-containing protein n=1 Tax=Coniochaeta ligniaria NRRL 30616 TaxID=1408157 RepID=A0A1J7I616_9PEZI|nr:hypothetical protein CONLIGDRAFT_145590 [Coniochaeta ligniaria NRRL 30616]
MVGVPGRSKGCHNCRSRKIKCDGERPSCKNCAKSNRICTGYQKKHAFILSKDMVADGATSSHDGSALPADRSESSMVMVSRWRKSSSKPAISSAQLSASSTPRDNDLPSAIGNTTLPKEIPVRSVFRDRILALNLEDPHNVPTVRLAYGERNDWLLHILDLPELTPALEDSLLAIAVAQLGQRTSRPELLHESLKLYTKGLAELRLDILNPSKRNNDQNLAACLASLLYEVTASPGGTQSGYKAHYLGTLELLRLRGAGAHGSGLAHSVFKVLRIHAVFNGIVKREKSFLADAEWVDGPWPQPDSKPPFERLIDILLGLPDLSAQRHAQWTTQNPLGVLSGALASVRSGTIMEAGLEKWFDSFKATVPGALYHPELSKFDSAVDSPDTGRIFPVAFQFPAFVIANNLVYYWVALMAVQAHLCFTYAMLTQLVAMLDAAGRETFSCTCDGSEAPCLQHFSMERLPALGHRELWPRTTAYNIAQSVEYFMEQRQQGFGPGEIVPALALVQGFWRCAPGDWNREVAWVDDMIKRIREQGVSIGGCLGKSVKQDLQAVTRIFCGQGTIRPNFN